MNSHDPHTRPHFESSALLTVDLQVDFLDGGPAEIAGTRAVLPAVRELVDTYRSAGLPIIHMVRLYLADGSNADLPRRSVVERGGGPVLPGTPGAQLAGDLFDPLPSPRLDAALLLDRGEQQCGPAEWLMYKPRWNAFFGTGLPAKLVSAGIDTVVVAGCNYPNCPRATAFGASERDFRVVMDGAALSGITPQAKSEMAAIGVLVYEHQRILDEVIAVAQIEGRRTRG